MSAVAVAQTTGAVVTVTVTIDAGVVGTMTIVRVDPDSSQHPVMAATAVEAASGVWIDPEAPLDATVTYRALLSTGDVIVSDPIIVLSALPMLSDPYRGLTVPVRVISLDDQIERDTRATAVTVEGRADRIILWDVESSPRHAAVELMTHTDADTATLDTICATGDPILLRTPCPTIPDVWIQRLGSRSVKRWRKSGETRLHTWPDCEVLAGTWRPGVRPAGDTLGDLDAAVGSTTLLAIADRWPTLLAIASDDLRALS